MHYSTLKKIIKGHQLISQTKYDEFFRKTISSIRCHHCCSAMLTIHDTYQRYVYLNKEVRNQIWVTRMKCNSCNKTFVVLPPSIIPFKRYVLVTVAMIIAITEIISEYKALEIYEIAKSHLRYWMKQYQKWHKVWVSIGEFELPPPDADSFSITYQKLTNHTFMQIISTR